MHAATHISDCDGIISAALILRKFPDAIIDFHTIDSIKQSLIEYDIVVDLPKSPKALVNIDHHESNFENLKKTGRLTEKDMVVPDAPSAASVLIKYLKLEDDPIARELVEMANIADTGGYTDETIILDKLIKASQHDIDFLRYLAKVLSLKGKKFLEDEKLKAKWKEVLQSYEKYKGFACKVADNLQPSDFVIIDERNILPYFVAKDLAYELFTRNKAKVVALIYDSPYDEEKVRVSFRVHSQFNFNVRKIAEKFGGGGHAKASGATFTKGENILEKIIDEITKYSEVGEVLVVVMKNSKFVDTLSS